MKKKGLTKDDFKSMMNKLGSSRDEFVTPRATGGVYDIIAAFGSDMVLDLVKKLEEGSKDVTGALKDSIQWKIKRFGQSYTFDLSLLEYYKYVDKGRKKGKYPPVSKIYDWIKLKQRTLWKGLSEKKMRSLSWAVSTSIYKKGIKPYPFFTSTVRDGRIGKLSKDLSKALGRDVMFTIKEFKKEIKIT